MGRENNEPKYANKAEAYNDLWSEAITAIEKLYTYLENNSVETNSSNGAIDFLGELIADNICPNQIVFDDNSIWPDSL